MNTFAEKYNAGNFEFCGKCYTDSCDVTVKTPSGDIKCKNPAEVTAFLKDTLAGAVGAKEVKFTVTECGGNAHKDTWTSTAGTGTCDATWELQPNAKEGELKFKVKTDTIVFTPKAA